MDQSICSFQVLAASGVVGDSGKPIDIHGCYVLSGGTAAQPFFKNGAAVSAPTVFIPGPMTISQGNLFAPTGPSAVRFGSGLYVSFDANTTTVTVFFNQALT